jgi:hypothetical protein
LYGPTLEPYLFGEQIGQALLAKSRNRPLLICTDREPALAVGDYVDIPVALVLPSEVSVPSTADVPATDTQWRVDPAHHGPRLVTFRLGRNCLAMPATSAEDQQRILDHLSGLVDSFDLTEPFGRIREAIQEARRGG